MPKYRGTFVGELTKQQYDIIDTAEKVAAELGTVPNENSLQPMAEVIPTLPDQA